MYIIKQYHISVPILNKVHKTELFWYYWHTIHLLMCPIWKLHYTAHEESAIII